MQLSSWVRRIIGAPLCGWLLGICALLLLPGCSTLRFAYDQAGALGYWWLDAQLDLDAAQTTQVRESLGRWLQWHRRSELPLYAAMLARGEAQVHEGASAEQACRWFDEILARVDAAGERAVPALADLARTVSAEQLAHLERRHAKADREFADDYLQADPAERLKAALTRAQDRAETLYGRLDAAQSRVLRQLVAQSPFDPELWRTERRRRQLDVQRLLRRQLTEPMSVEQTQAEVRRLIGRIRQSPDDAWRSYEQRLRLYNCQGAAALHNATTASQRREAAQRLKGWRDDVNALTGAR